MAELTKRQRQIVDFIDRHRQNTGVAPSFKEIADQFGFRSPTTVADHLRLIRKSGALTSEPGQARSLRVISPFHALRKRVVDIPVYGSIPAGFADERKQEARAAYPLTSRRSASSPRPRTFALEVRGDSMIGKHIMNGDLVVLEHGMTPRNGDVVAALIDNESTLKTFVMERNKPFLRAENPRYPKMIPASELVIQGVMIALIRKRK
jgi:repressor LexA